MCDRRATRACRRAVAFMDNVTVSPYDMSSGWLKLTAAMQKVIWCWKPPNKPSTTTLGKENINIHILFPAPIFPSCVFSMERCHPGQLWALQTSLGPRPTTHHQTPFILHGCHQLLTAKTRSCIWILLDFSHTSPYTKPSYGILRGFCTTFHLHLACFSWRIPDTTHHAWFKQWTKICGKIHEWVIT